VRNVSINVNLRPKNDKDIIQAYAHSKNEAYSHGNVYSATN